MTQTLDSLRSTLKKSARLVAAILMTMMEPVIRFMHKRVEALDVNDSKGHRKKRQAGDIAQPDVVRVKITHVGAVGARGRKTASGIFNPSAGTCFRCMDQILSGASQVNALRTRCF